MSSLTIFTDGGSSSRGGSGAACILQSDTASHCIVISLGEATNNECEIFSIILGLAVLRLLEKSEGNNYKDVVWYSDSEYSLKSAGQYIFSWMKNGWKTASKNPVKNQGLWKTFSSLRKGLSIDYRHVRGHSGHLENEACDAAVGYVRDNNKKQQPTWLDIGSPPYLKWYVLDGVSALSAIRANEEAGLSLSELLPLIPGIEGSTKPPVVPELVESGSSSSRARLAFATYTREYLKRIESLDFDYSKEGIASAVKDLEEWLKVGE